MGHEPPSSPAPVLGAGEVALEPRPHTEEPVQVVEIHKDQLLAMSNEEISNYVWNAVGVYLDPRQDRSKLLQDFMKLVMEVVQA